MYRIVKVLNHNAVLAVNAEDGKECLLMGKGIGFGKKVSEHVEPGEDARIYTLQASGERGQAGEIVKSIRSFWRSRTWCLMRRRRCLEILTATFYFRLRIISVMRWSA